MSAKSKKTPVPNRLEEIRRENGENLTEAAKRCGIAYTTYISYEKRQREMDSEVLIQISQALGITIDHLLYRDGNVVQIKSPLVQKYEKLDDTAKRVVDSVIEIELSRTAQKPAEEIPKIIPLFAAAAGPGEPQEGNAFDQIEATDERADFAVRISGDSMLPYFEPGEIVMCKNKIEFETGEIVVVMVNGFLLVKQFYEGYNGQWYLRSLNRERSNLDYDYIPSSTDTPAPYGVVICKRIPLVEQ